MKHSLLHTMGNQRTGLGGSVLPWEQCTGLGGSVLDQHSTNTLGEIKEITVLCTLPIYRAPLKFTTKQKQEITEALSSPLL